MNIPAKYRRLGAIAALVLVAGCTRSEPPVPKLPPRMAVEPQADHALWLPSPGMPSRIQHQLYADMPASVPLRPRAESARQRGLTAAQANDWPAAIAAFQEAQQSAHAVPGIYYNLALAYERAGILVPAAMWYRAYLAAEPHAANSAAVRGETERLIAVIETRALGMMDEAERLAGTLPATPPAAGVMSLRQGALETIASYAYMGGMEERGERLSRAAQALPGADAVVEKRTYWDRHGLYAAAYAWDGKRVDGILARHTGDYPPDIQESYRGFVLGQRGDQAALLALMDRYPSWSPPRALGVRALPTRAYAVIERLVTRTLSTNTGFDVRWFLFTAIPATEAAFWDGRPDIGIRLATAALAHLRKHDINDDFFGYRRMYTLLLHAIVGDVAAIKADLQRPPMLPPEEDNLLAGGIALALLASTTPADAIAVVDLMMENIFRTYAVKIDQAAIEKALYPLAYIVRRLAAGELNQAVALLDSVADRADHEAMVRLLLMYSVSTGRYMALNLGERMKGGASALLHLNRLAEMPGVEPAKIAEFTAFAKATSGGWRPWDGRQSRRVWTCVEHAGHLNPKEYGLLPDGMDDTVKNEPEKIPTLLAAHALIQWMGALAARREETVYGRDYFGAPELLGD